VSGTSSGTSSIHFAGFIGCPSRVPGGALESLGARRAIASDMVVVAGGPRGCVPSVVRRPDPTTASRTTNPATAFFDVHAVGPLLWRRGGGSHQRQKKTTLKDSPDEHGEPDPLVNPVTMRYTRDTRGDARTVQGQNPAFYLHLE
jgi:hypothetical protein